MSNNLMNAEQRSKFFSLVADELNEALAQIPEDQEVQIGMFILKGTKPVDKGESDQLVDHRI